MVATPRADLLAGLTVGLVALPLALAFGVSSGLGAGAGLVTAVVAGIVAAVFGGSNLQVSGPTGAMTVVLVPLVARHGPGGVVLVGVLAGLLLLAMAVCGLGRYMRYVPLPVVEGFTLGIATVIALQQVPAALGVDGGQGKVLARAWHAALTDPRWSAVGLTALVVAVMLLVGWWRPALPASVIAIAVATTVAELWSLDVRRVGALPSHLPLPAWDTLPWSDLRSLLGPAVAVALLAALESLLSATVADAMSVSERHDPDRELFGQGLANLASPLLGGMPATAAIARTAVNVRSGGRSRLASVSHAVFLLAAVLALAPLVGRIPLAALAGVLLVTCARMVEIRGLSRIWRSGRGEATVLTATVVATVVLDLVQAVLLGVVVAGAVALRHMAQAVSVEEQSLDDGGHGDEEHALLDQHIVAFRIDGPLFFASAHQALLELAALSDVRVVILRLSRVTSIDATAAALLRDTLEHLSRRGITVLVSGVSARLAPVIEAAGVRESLAHERHLFASTPEAIAHARAHVSRSPHHVGDGVREDRT